MGPATLEPGSGRALVTPEQRQVWGGGFQCCISAQGFSHSQGRGCSPSPGLWKAPSGPLCPEGLVTTPRDCVAQGCSTLEKGNRANSRQSKASGPAWPGSLGYRSLSCDNRKLSSFRAACACAGREPPPHTCSLLNTAFGEPSQGMRGATQPVQQPGLRCRLHRAQPVAPVYTAKPSASV